MCVNGVCAYLPGLHMRVLISVYSKKGQLSKSERKRNEKEYVVRVATLLATMGVLLP